MQMRTFSTSTYCSLSIYRRSEILSARKRGKRTKQPRKATVWSLGYDITLATIAKGGKGENSNLPEAVNKLNSSITQ